MSSLHLVYLQVDIVRRTLVLEKNEEQLVTKRDGSDLRTIVVFCAFHTSSDVIDVGETSLIILQFILDNMQETLE
jgi:hypothetical protein